ncbi:heme exporter protein CcmD [Aliidiomarina quisquiliarum]|uniref:heme exporter protein CcmD n=1 Tax=Aliidiomarina quisquiliarum TaxID=2938947 RepID=UPI00208E1739|nr:heme exporter protein CcmD [Aliidiomarina quisquiliarum]MCO4321692.1 heme exporter protein CcmD [Aliidiomarina quisquiliarum]
MYFDSFSAFIHMGGYGVYVWSSMFVTFFGLGALALEASWARRKITQEARAQQARAERIQRAKSASTQQQSGQPS